LGFDEGEEEGRRVSERVGAERRGEGDGGASPPAFFPAAAAACSVRRSERAVGDFVDLDVAARQRAAPVGQQRALLLRKTLDGAVLALNRDRRAREARVHHLLCLGGFGWLVVRVLRVFGGAREEEEDVRALGGFWAAAAIKRR